MTGGALAEGPRTHETDLSLVDYTRSLLLPDDPHVGFNPVDDLGEIEVWTVRGYAGPHRLVVDLDPTGDHDHLREQVIKRMGPQWRPFAVAYNPEDDWTVTHWEPVETARPL